MNKDVDGKKVVVGGKKPDGRGKQGAGWGKKVVDRDNKGTSGGNKPTGRGKRVEHNLLNVNGSFLVSPNLPKDDIEDGYVSEQLCNDDSDEDVLKKKYERFNPKLLCKEFKWRLGLEFAFLKEFKEAILEYNVLI